MRKLVYVVVAVALAVAAALTITDAPAQADAVDGNTVAICHFPGHTAPADVDPPLPPGIDGDFVLDNPANPTGCLNRGGNPIVVGIKACLKGHRAATTPSGSSCEG